ncbi:pyridoxal phosphate-dependent aminotransferase [Desulfitibacter alkalitolerans]|uniref:pyridoxal phosphate-dependent aminotransferase n=1 Tax=Desulfitibacter alkalitolerans TaxID=264641 RepID=UPI000487A8A8|nr:pyridoxal phosphate-dependent aminotransferase [Desulfitibacter alkalitolerans]
MKRFLADRLSGLGTESAFEVLAKARKLESQGVKVIHMEIGEPDFSSPSRVVGAAARAMHQGQTKYCPAGGLASVQEVIADYSGKLRNINYDAGEVVIVPGAKPILSFTMMACVNPGDEVIYPNPGFPIYESLIRFCGGIPVPIQIEEIGDNFSLDVNKLRSLITSKTKMLILNSPHNPTGGILTDKELEEIANLCVEHDLLVLSDEVYSKIYYEEVPKSIASYPGMKERTVVVDGFSKTFSMTGWRLGYGLMPQELAQHITRLVINSNSCTPPFVQIAGAEALQNCQDETEKMVKEFAKRREILINGLNSIPGFYCHKPKGAFYAFPNISSTGRTSSELSHELLEKAGVAVLDGGSFGIYGRNYIRLSYATSIDNIYAALNRIDSFLNNKKVSMM